MYSAGASRRFADDLSRATVAGQTRDSRPITVPAVVSLHLGAVTSTAALQRVTLTGATGCDAVATISVVRQPMLVKPLASDDGDGRTARALHEYAHMHLGVLKRLAGVVAMYETEGSAGASSASNAMRGSTARHSARGFGSLGGGGGGGGFDGGAGAAAGGSSVDPDVALGSISAVGGAIVMHDGMSPVVDAAAAHSGLHFCDGDYPDSLETEAGGSTVPGTAPQAPPMSAGELDAELLDDGVAGGVYRGSLEYSEEESLRAAVGVALRRPVYVTRVRFETDTPTFDQWFRLRLSRLSPTTVVVISLFDVKVPSDPVPLACTFLPVGIAAPPLSALRNVSPITAAATGRRSSIASLLHTQRALAAVAAAEAAAEEASSLGLSGVGTGEHDGEGDGYAGSSGGAGAVSSLMGVVLRTSPVPVGLFSDPHYVFQWGPIPCGASPTWAGKEAVLGDAEDAGVEAMVRSSRKPFCAGTALPLYTYDSSGRLVSATTAGLTLATARAQRAAREAAALSAANTRTSLTPAGWMYAETMNSLLTRVGSVQTGLGAGAGSGGGPTPVIRSDAVTAPALLVDWRVDTDADPVGVRGALILRSVGIAGTHPLSDLPIPYLRSLGESCGPTAEKFADVASVLPVLEPLFRFMSARHNRGVKAAKMTRSLASATGGRSGAAAGARTPHSRSRTRKKAASPRSNSRQLALEAGLPPEEESVLAAEAEAAVAASGLSDDEGGEDDEEAMTGLDEQIFVGVCAHCTTLPESALRTAFRQLDANGDKLLLWDEFVSYISRLLDNDLAKRAAQGTYLLIPPAEGGGGAGKGAGGAGSGLPGTSRLGGGGGTAGDDDSAAGSALSGGGASLLLGAHEDAESWRPPSSPAVAVVQAMLSKSIALGGGRTDADGRPAKRSIAAQMRPPSKAEVLASVEPARTVKADSDGVGHVCLAPELQGLVVAYRNHTAQVLDDGFREAIELDLHAGLNMLNDVLPSALLADMNAAARAELDAALSGSGGGGGGGSADMGAPAGALPIHAMDWAGDTICVLAVLCADRRIRIYELGRYVSYGTTSLKDVINKRVGAEVLRLHDEYERNLQAALVAESVAHRKAGLAELSKRARSLGLDTGSSSGGRGGGGGRDRFIRTKLDPIEEAMRPEEIEKLPKDAFILQAVLSVNIANPAAVRDEIDREARRESKSGGGSGGGADGAGGRGAAGADSSKRNRSARARARGTSGELEDLIDYGRGTDYLRLRASKATGLSLAMGGVGSAHGGELSLDDGADSSESVAATQRRLRQLTFGGSRHRRDGDPRLQALLAASRGEGATARRVGGKLQSLEGVNASAFVRVRNLKDGMPTTLKLVTLRLYARHHTGFDPHLASTALPTNMTARPRAGATVLPGGLAGGKDGVAGSSSGAMGGAGGGSGGGGGGGGASGFASASSSGAPLLLAALVGDNKGIVTAHRITLGGPAVSIAGPTAPGSGGAPLTAAVKTPLASISCLVTLPARDSEASSSDGMVLSSSTSTVVVGGSGPITIVSLALGFERRKLLADQGGGATTAAGSGKTSSSSAAAAAGAAFRLTVLRVLNSTTAFAHPHGVSSLAYCSTERCLVSTGPDRKVLLWNVTDSARADAQIGQLGMPTAIASDRDQIVSLTTSDIHNMVVTVTKGGRVEIFDPRTLACIQRVNEDATVVFTKGVVVDPYHLVLVTFGSHLRAWSIRETFLNNVNAAIAVAKAMAHEHRIASAAFDGPSPSAMGGGGSPSGAPTSSAGGAFPVSGGGSGGSGSGMLAAVGADADVTALMAATPWLSISRGYLDEGALIPKPPPKEPEHDARDDPHRRRGDGLTSAVIMSRVAGRIRDTAGELVKDKHAEEAAEADRAARRTSAVPSDVQTMHDLQVQLGGRFVRRGSIEAQLVANMVESLRNQGRSEAEEADDDDADDAAAAAGGKRGKGATVTRVGASATASSGMDGRSLLTALYSRAFNQVAAVSRDGLVKVFDVSSGRMVLSFMADHTRKDSEIGLGATHRLLPNPAAIGATMVQLTSATLDVRHRRLITGSVHGSCRVWNLANGMLLRNLIPVPGCELSAVAYHPSSNITLPLLAGTSSGKMAFWKDQGRIGDDTAGQGATISAALVASGRGASAAGMAGATTHGKLPSDMQAEERERDLLQLHVRVGETSVGIYRGSDASPAALLHKQNHRPGGGGGIVSAAVAARRRRLGTGPAREDEVAQFHDYLDAMKPAGVTWRGPPRPPAPTAPATGPATPRTFHLARSGRTLTPSASTSTAASGAGVDVTSTFMNKALMNTGSATPGRLDPELVDALTSPRYLSVEARSIISSARRDVASQHGVSLRDRLAHSPRSLLSRFPAPSSPRYGHHHAPIRGPEDWDDDGAPVSAQDAMAAAAAAGLSHLLDDDDLANVISKEITADLVQEKARGVIAVFGGAGGTDGDDAGDGDARAPGSARKPVTAPGHSNAVAAEALAAYQRLAPRVVDVPESSTVLALPAAGGSSMGATSRTAPTGEGMSPRPPPGAHPAGGGTLISTRSMRASTNRGSLLSAFPAASPGLAHASSAFSTGAGSSSAASSATLTGVKAAALRADVVALVTGGGVPVDGHLVVDTPAGEARLAPWAISVSSDGMLVQWSPTTERPQSWRALLDPDIASGHMSAAVSTACTFVPNQGVVVVGTLAGCLHVLTVHAFTLLRAGRLVGCGRYPRRMVMGAGGEAELGALLERADTAEEAPLRTAFYTLPITPEWNSVRRGAGVSIPARDVAGEHSVLAASTAAAAAAAASESGAASRARSRGRRRSSPSPDLPPETVPMLVTRGVTCLAANSFGSRLMVGYEGGFLRLFDLWPLQEDGWKCFDKPMAEWRAHLTRFGVASVELMTLSSGTELFMTAGGFEVKMWTSEGHFIGMFGQGGPWPMLLHTSAPGTVATAASKQAEDIIQGFTAGERRGSESPALASPTRRPAGHPDRARAGSSSSSWSPQSPKAKGPAGGGGGGTSPHASSAAGAMAAGLCSAFHFGWTRAPLRPGSMRPPGSLVPPLAASLLAVGSFASPSRAGGALSPNPGSFRAGTPATGTPAAGEAAGTPPASPIPPGSPSRSLGAGRRPVGGPTGVMAVPDRPAAPLPHAAEDGMDLSTYDRRGSSLHILASRRHSAQLAASTRLRAGSAASASPSIDDDVPAPRSQFLRTRVEDRATVDATQVAAERSLLRTGSTTALRSTVPGTASGGTPLPSPPAGIPSLAGTGTSSFAADGAAEGEPFVPGAVRRRRASIEKRPDLLARVHSSMRMTAPDAAEGDGSEALAATARGPVTGVGGVRSPFATLAGKPTYVDDRDSGSGVDVTGVDDGDVWAAQQPPVTLSSVTQELRHQRRRHGERLGQSEAAAAALPSYTQNPFTYAGAGRWISKKELGGGGGV